MKPSKDKEKNKGGRPKQDLADKIDFDEVERLASLGLTDVEIGYVLSVSEVTINNWKKDERFSLALKRGKAVADTKVTESLYKRACGFTNDEVKIFQNNGKPVIVPFKAYYPPDTTAAIFWLKNRQPEKWKDKQVVENEGGVTVKIIREVVHSNARD